MDFTGQEWRYVQKKAFLRWTNSQLKDRAMQVYDLNEDFRDGVKLCHLMEIISGKSLGRFKNKPKVEMQKIENCRTCVQFMKREGLKIVNIDGNDIYNGDEKLIMGLLWMVILRYEINKGGKGGIGDAKNRLLAWIRTQIPEYEIRNFTKDWNDGTALNALNNSLYDGACPNYADLDPNDALGNATLGIETAERVLGVDKLVYPNEMIHPKVDEHAMMAYLAQFMDCTPPTNAADLCKAWGKGLEFGYANRPMNFGVSKPPGAEGTFDVRVEGPGDCSAPVFIDDLGNGEFEVSYNPTIPGAYQVFVSLNGVSIPGSVFSMTVLPAHMRVFFGTATKKNKNSALKNIETSLQSGGPVSGLKDWTPIDTQEKDERDQVMDKQQGKVRALLVVMDGKDAMKKFIDSGVTERLIKMGQDLGASDSKTERSRRVNKTGHKAKRPDSGRTGGNKKLTVCPKCQNELPTGASNMFCVSCGNKLR